MKRRLRRPACRARRFPRKSGHHAARRGGFRIASPVFILSFRHRNELAALAERGGWSPVAARRAENAERRFVLSGAGLAVVDARGALDEGVAAIRTLADPVEANAGALLALISRNDLASLDDVFAAGATHFLASPFREDELLQSLRFAERHARRIGREHRARPRGEEVQAEQRSASDRDPLTGLGDARGARRWIETRLANGSPSPRMVLLLLAISRFDMVNAAYGHGAGDAALQGMARRIERVLGATGGRDRLIARVAGAEFLIGLNSASSAEQARFLAEGLVAALGGAFVWGDQLIRLSAHCGVVTDRAGDGDAAAVLRRASTALAEARSEADGRQVRLLDENEEGEAARGNRLEIDLRLALAQNEIELLFQPQVSVTSGAIVGVEALARWRHPALGDIGATALFAAAERSDYLSELSEHIQRRAVSEVARWPDALAELRVAINVTAADIASPGFAARFAALADKAGVSRGRITLELTESGLIRDLGAAADVLAALRGEGFRVAIDDFGTGYSSLAYLKSLPLDYLKIDKGLSGDIEGSPRDRVVIRGVIEMARSLGLTVIAEGVETDAQLALLAEEGVTIYQGFLCSAPIESGELAGLVVPPRNGEGNQP